MVERPIYSPTDEPYILYFRHNIEFVWNSGFSEIQKKKNVLALHAAANRFGINKILEISSKSEFELGRRLSSFYLKYETIDGIYPLECVYQGGKVFEKGGPFVDIFNLSPREAKRDVRLKNSGNLIYFKLDGIVYPNVPFNAFYDWIYIRALFKYQEYIYEYLNEADGFSDVEFNPNTSINTQARALAVFLTLIRKKQLNNCVNNFEYFVYLLNINEKHNSSPY